MNVVSYFVVILCFAFLSIPLHADQLEASKPLSSDMHKSVEQVLSVLDQHYVYPETATRMRQYVEKSIESGNYRSIQSNQSLIEKLQIDLRQVSKDDHISLHLSEGVIDRQDHTRPMTKEDARVEFSIETDSTSDQKVGYLRVNKFGDETIKAKIVAAMSELSSTASLIIDLRDNGGGDANLVAFLSAYFLDSNTHLWSIFDRDGKPVFDAYTPSKSPPLVKRYHGELCVLISSKMYSAPEAFAYTLKHLDRACIIGEASRGGAHLVQMERVNDEIDIRIPVARAYNPITKSNWEGVGVIPDIHVKASNAKAAALEHFKSQKN